jgi:putative sigma-54 modulation protein
MDIRISGRHVEVTPAIKTYATDKVSKLPRYFDRVTHMDVVLDKVDNHTYDVEIIVEAEHTTKFVAHEKGPDLYAGIDTAVDKLERQLTDHKEKLRIRKGRSSIKG